MADISDVETAMVSLIANSLQLGQKYLPGSVVPSPIAKARCEIFRGWPIASDLAPKLSAGVSIVSVFPVPGSTRRVTRYVPQWSVAHQATPTLTISALGNSVTIGGVSSTSQVIGIRLGVPGQTAVYRPVAGDDPITIAAALSAHLAGSSSVGPTITLPTDIHVDARVVCDQTAWTETRRQEQNVWVIGWCPNPSTRDVVMSAVDSGFANMVDPFGNLTDQFPMPDGSSGRILYISSHTDDQAQKAGIWRRDLRYTVNYPTTLTQTFSEVLFGVADVTETTSGITFTTITDPS